MSNIQVIKHDFDKNRDIIIEPLDDGSYSAYLRGDKLAKGVVSIPSSKGKSSLRKRSKSPKKSKNATALMKNEMQNDFFNNEINESYFDELININLKDKSKPLTFILFYAPWCGHCHRFKPEWINFANKINKSKTLKNKVDVLSFNCDNESNKQFLLKVRENWSISGYPTVHLYTYGVCDGEEIRERSSDALIEKCNKLLNLQ